MVGPAWRPPEEFEEFRLVRSLGRGAMGQVYLAHDSLLDRSVAVKFVHAAEDPAARAQFIEEARAIARLQHPNVVAIHRVAEVAGHPYLVSEYVRGRGLDQLDRPVPWPQVLEIAIDLARGLAAAHRCGVLHRDVKPANAMLTDDGRAKLLDFSLASITDGTPAESSPVALPPESRSDRGNQYLAAIERTAASPVHAAPASVSLLPVIDAAAPSSLGSGDPIARLTVEDTWGMSSHRRSPGPGAGTPLYMAPEVWRGDPATFRSDLYSLGILLYELLSGTAPHRGLALGDLASAVQDRDIPRLGDVVPGIEPALAAIVDRLVERHPGARFASADALLVALEESAAPTPLDGHPDDNPYRGLAAFESAHGALFFGRRGEIRELVDRVRTEAFIVVGGDSGTGKSSLCRAGVLPWLAAHDGWSCVEVIPGRHPVRSLAAALADWMSADEAELAVLLRDDPDAVARAIRQNLAAGDRRSSPGLQQASSPGSMPAATEDAVPPRRLLLFVDQLEELLTLSEPDEAGVVASALAALAVRTPSVRVLATGRSDFLSRLATLPGLGDAMSRGLYFLCPLVGERIREVIVRPAAAKGVVFESEALVDVLVEQTRQAPGGLPLLQFTLAELWDARDVAARTIRADSLATLGGVEGALTRHADRLLAGLDASEQAAARRLLLRLVTAEGTRARRPEAELLTDGAGRGAERAALEGLVRGRVVVANDAQHGAYELAHEALLASWSTLQGWLKTGAADQAVRGRVEQAAAAWQRVGRPRDLLWGRRLLAETRALDRDGLAPREAAFLAASDRALLRARILGAGGAALLVISAVVVGLVLRARTQRELEAVIETQLRSATAALDDARQIAKQHDAARGRAFGLFDAYRWSEGEDVWREVEGLAAREASQYRDASGYFESALSLDPSRASLRDQFADLTFERLRRAQRDHHGDLADELAGRLTTYDDGRRRAELDADARVVLEIATPGTRVWSERPGTARHFLGASPLPPLTLAPGSVILSFEAPGRVAARLPVLLSPGQTAELRVALPAAASAPAGMIYVPPGRFLFGSADTTDLRRGFLNAAPLHEVETAGYFIGRYEVTFGDWIEFLEELPADERRRRSPRSVGTLSFVTLTELGPKRWRLTLMPSARTYTAETGQRLRYERRTQRAEQDWMKFPVSAVSYEDAVAYAAWLDRTRRVVGARLCDDHEWERAARGGDGRRFPTGATLVDANIDVTYGREPLAFGPDEVGSHPGSRSPVGADDMAGNVWEWTRSVQTADAPVARGGGWYNAELNARSMNREYGEPTQRHALIGVRVCATPR